MSYNKTGVYIHIPFCRNKCDYCNFYSVPAEAEGLIIKSYIERLKQEIRDLPDGWFLTDADTIYFGGGTPSMLSPGDIESIIVSLQNRFSFGEAEITIEMNPEDFTTDKVRGYVSSGVNRIVLGIQSLNKALRRTIGRRGNTEVRKILDKFFLQQGFNRCIDLITGIPGQTYENCLEDLIIISGYRPEHISLYLLSVESGTPLSERLITDDLFDDMQLTVWGRSIDFLVNEGYNHYEISNFSLPGFESIHNSKYWHFIPYAGFGAGAHSFTGSTRYSNNMLLNDYIRQKHVVYTFDNRNESDIVVEFFMTALRDLRGFTVVEFRAVTGFELTSELFRKIESLLHRGLISENNGKYFLTRMGLFSANSVIYELTEDYIR